MTYKIDQIEGIGTVYAERLQNAGISTVDQLLEQGKTPKGRAALAESTGISPKLILTWVNHADLFRIKGIAGQFAELLEASGVDTVKELSHRNAENLHAAMEAKNEEHKLVNRVPAVSELQRMIDEAKTLPRMVEY